VVAPRLRLRGATAMSVLAALVAAPPVALAQVGLGAERYEVTISPPKRPGSEGVEATGEAAPEGTGEGSASPSASAPPTDPDQVLGGAEAVPPPATPGAAVSSAAAPPAVSDAATARTAPAGPLRMLQVGAFRLKKSAGELRDALASEFPDVAIVEVQSGGEPLYRVNVGRLPRGPALDDLKRRLVAAGHPAFEVAAPAASGSR
jgi:cell division protein FtsN